MGVILVASWCITTANNARHKHYVDVHHTGFGSRQNTSKSELHQNVRSVVSWMLFFHLWQLSRICVRQYNLASQEQRGIEKGMKWSCNLQIALLFVRTACDINYYYLMQVNSKYILKSTLTPRPTRKDMSSNLQKSRSCSSLEGNKPANNNTFNNYLTVHVSHHRTSLSAFELKMEFNYFLLVFPQ